MKVFRVSLVQVMQREGNELEEVKLDGVDGRRQKSERDKLHEQKAETWRMQQVNDGAHASHLRSHNIAPVPRVYGSPLLNQVVLILIV